MAREAKFVDGHELPEKSVLFLGMSMKTQLKLKGENLKAVAERYVKSEAEFKWVYLCDSVHAMNISSSQIISFAQTTNIITDAMLDAVSPDFHIAEVTRDGDDWELEHNEKFLGKNHQGIKRHSEIRKNHNFESLFTQACDFYCNDQNRVFFENVNSIVATFLGRTLSKKDKILEKIRATQYDGKGRLPDQSIPLNRATTRYIEDQKKFLLDSGQATKAGLVAEDFNSPIIQELIKNSLRYVLEELCGFRIAALDILQQLGPAYSNISFYYVYPGNLDVVNSYFQLVPGINMLVKPVKIKKSKAAGTSSDESSIEDSLSCSPSDDFERKVIDSYFTVLQNARSASSECRVKPDDVVDLINAMERKKSPGSSPKTSPKHNHNQESKDEIDYSKILNSQAGMFRKSKNQNQDIGKLGAKTEHPRGAAPRKSPFDPH